jgi:hypothetical protein
VNSFDMLGVTAVFVKGIQTDAPGFTPEGSVPQANVR